MWKRFDADQESLFEADYAERTLASVRFGLGLGGLLYALFAVLDLWMLPVSWRSAHLIRFGIVIPLCLVAIALTFTTRGKGQLQTIVSTFAIVAGLGIVGMIGLAEESEPGFRYYYAGLLLVLTFSFAVVRLRFWSAAVCCIVIIGAYLCVATLDQHLLAEGIVRGRGPVFLNNSYFLVAAGIITLMGSYLLEDYARKDFLQRDELSRTLEELKATQTQLVQSERTAAMGSVVAGLLHELNNPVGAIASASDVVNRAAQRLPTFRSEVSEPEKKTMGLIETNADVVRAATARVTEALEVLKRFTHLDKAESAEYDLNQALEDCVTLLAPETDERITVTKRLEEVPKIRCRPTEVNQALLALLKNAVESIRGNGQIELRTSQASSCLQVDIMDTGVGIDRERLKTLFVPNFSRGGARVKLGLGLITAQRTLQQHGGSLEIESDVGKGTHVKVTLPLKGHGE